VAFSAFVRLSSDTPAEEREKRVDDVISKMDLENCANTRVRSYSWIRAATSNTANVTGYNYKYTVAILLFNLIM